MDKIKGVIKKFNDLITAAKLQKTARDSELLKDVYGTILTDEFNKIRMEND